jgi:hypothetical protein
MKLRAVRASLANSAEYRSMKVWSFASASIAAL